MAGSLVKAGNRGIIPLSPSTLGVHDAPAPQPPRAASGMGRAGGGGGQGGHATQNSHCLEGTCGLEGQGGAPGRPQERQDTATVRRHAGWGNREKQRWRQKSCGGIGRRSFLPAEEGRGAPTRTDIYGLRKKGTLDSDLPHQRVAQALIPTAHSPLIRTPDTPAHTPHPTEGRGGVSKGSFPTSNLSIIRTTAQAPRRSRDSAPNPHQSTQPVHSTQTGRA